MCRGKELIGKDFGLRNILQFTCIVSLSIQVCLSALAVACACSAVKSSSNSDIAFYILGMLQVLMIKSASSHQANPFLCRDALKFTHWKLRGKTLRAVFESHLIF